MSGKGTGSAIEWHGPEQVLAGYDLHASERDNIAYSLWQGNVIKFTYDQGPIDLGRDKLEQNLETLVNNQSTALYTLRFHPWSEDMEITNKTPVSGSGNFRIAEVYARQMAQVNNSPALEQLAELIKGQNERLARLEAKLDEPEEEEEEEMMEVEEEEDDDGIGRVLGHINKIETTIQSSPLLNQLYGDLRLFLRSISKKWGGDIPETQTNISGMANSNAQQKKPLSSEEFAKNMSELVRSFPELPDILMKLHGICKDDPETFALVRNKIIKSIDAL